MKLQNIALYLLAFSAFISCIALTDEFDPTISVESEAGKTYYYKDTFKLNVVFKDNVLIEEGRIRIRMVDTLSTVNDTILFTYDSTYQNVRARQLEVDSSMLVPLNVRTGKYFIEVSNEDADENFIADTSYFYIGTDTMAPVIEQITVTSAIEGNQGSTTFCRGERLLIDALIHDNLSIKKLGIQIGVNTPRYFSVDGDSLNVVDVVQRQFFVPDSLVNGEYDLTLLVEDQFGNKSQVVTSINISCDDEPAFFVSYSEASGIEIPSNRIVSLFPGENFSLSSLIFRDNGGLDSARLEVTRIGVSSVVGESGTITNDPIIGIDLDGVEEQDLATLFEDNFNFGFDLLETTAGETIFINVKVKDAEQTWDEASFFRFSLVAKEDLAPIIRIADLIIDDTKEYIPEDEVQDFTSRLVGKNNINIAVEGKVQENVGLSSIEYKFSSDREGIVNLEGKVEGEDSFTSYPVDLGTTLNTEFPISSSLAIQGDVLYTLKIVAKDIKGQMDSVSFNFNVTYPIE